MIQSDKRNSSSGYNTAWKMRAALKIIKMFSPRSRVYTIVLLVLVLFYNNHGDFEKIRAAITNLPCYITTNARPLIFSHFLESGHQIERIDRQSKIALLVDH